MPLKNIRHDIDIGRVRFSVHISSGMDLLDTLLDLNHALERAYTEATALFNVGSEGIPAMRWDGYRWIDSETRKPVPVMKEV